MMHIYKRNKTLLGILAILIVIGGLVWIANRPSTDPVDKASVEPTADETVVTGTFSCLPFKNGQAITSDNCVMGLAGDDSKEYALDTSQITILSKTISPNDHIRVVGVLYAPNTSVDEGNAFDIQGVIKVRAIQHAQAK
jgi:hypothetical protein